MPSFLCKRIFSRTSNSLFALEFSTSHTTPFPLLALRSNRRLGRLGKREKRDVDHLSYSRRCKRHPILDDQSLFIFSACCSPILSFTSPLLGTCARVGLVRTTQERQFETTREIGGCNGKRSNHHFVCQTKLQAIHLLLRRHVSNESQVVIW